MAQARHGLGFSFGVATLALGLGIASPAWAKTARNFVIRNPGCALEFKPMNRPSSPWRPYQGKLATGQNAKGFPVAPGSDTLTFSVAQPKNLFFRGSLSCLSKAPATSAPRAESPIIETPAAEVRPVEPVPEGFQLRISAQPLLWKESLLYDVQKPATAPDEELSGFQVGAGAGVLYEQFTGDFSWGGEAQVWGALSTVENALPETQVTTAFSASGFMVGLNLRPSFYYYFGRSRERFGVGPYLSLLARYAAYAAGDDGAGTTGSVASPFKMLVISGLSARFNAGPWAASLNGGFVGFKLSNLFIGVQVDF